MSQRKLLLADDSITIQKVVNLTFADEGIEVITVGDGDSAMDKLAEIKPDLIMADVNMPGLNGYQICERIRQSAELKNTPVILLVGSFEPFDEDEAKRVGANDFLTKPFQSIRQLVSKVSDLLQGSAQNGQSSASEDLQNAETLSSFPIDRDEYILPDNASRQSGAQFGDTGMDDEMIQTENASGFALDESSKFETREVDAGEYEDAGKTQPLSSEDLKQFSYADHTEETASFAESARETSNEENQDEQSSSENRETTEETDMAQTAPALEMDEDDLLEIPFDEDEEDWEEPETPRTETVSAANEQTQQQIAPAESSTVETAPVVSAEQSEISQLSSQDDDSGSLAQGTVETAGQGQFSPEMIDAIVQRVIEKLSDKAVKDVAWEVVPEMADLIIKKMAEEKLRE